MKWLKGGLVAFVFLAPFAILSAYYNPGNPSGFVNDFAGILTAEQKNSLEQKLSGFEKSTGNEIAVAIIPSLQGDTIEGFAVSLFQEWGIGKKDKDNGLLILVAMEERKVRIEVGYGLEGYVTDAQSSWVIKNQITPAFQEGDYYKGLSDAADKIISAVGGEAIPEDRPAENKKLNFDLIETILFFVFVVGVGLFRVLAMSPSWWAGGVLGGLAGVIVMFFNFTIGLILFFLLIPLGLLLDYLLSKSYKKSKSLGIIPWWFRGPRGGSGFGGGFGGFGGGRSGGGGASGSW